MLTITLVDPGGQIHATQTINAWDGAEDINLFTIQGRELGLGALLESGKPFVLQIAADLRVVPEPEIWRKSSGVNLRRWCVIQTEPGASDVRVLDPKGTVLWQPRVGLPIPPPAWTRQLEVQWDVREKSPALFETPLRFRIFALPAGTEIVFARLNGSPIPFDPQQGLLGPVTLTAELALSGFRFRIGLSRDGRTTIIERKADVPVAGALQLRKSGWKPLARDRWIGTDEARAVPCRIFIPSIWEEETGLSEPRAVLMEGAAYRGESQGTNASPWSLLGYGRNATAPTVSLQLGRGKRPAMCGSHQLRDRPEASVRKERGIAYESYFTNPSCQENSTASSCGRRMAAWRWWNEPRSRRTLTRTSGRSPILGRASPRVSSPRCRSTGSDWVSGGWVVFTTTSAACRVRLISSGPFLRPLSSDGFNSQLLETKWSEPILAGFAERHPLELIAAWFFDDGLDPFGLSHDDSAERREADRSVLRTLLIGWKPDQDATRSILARLKVNNPKDPHTELIDTLLPHDPLLVGNMLKQVWSNRTQCERRRLRAWRGHVVGIDRVQGDQLLYQKQCESLLNAAAHHLRLDPRTGIDENFVKGVADTAIEAFKGRPIRDFQVANLATALEVGSFRQYLGMRVLEELEYH